MLAGQRFTSHFEAPKAHARAEYLEADSERTDDRQEPSWIPTACGRVEPGPGTALAQHDPSEQCALSRLSPAFADEGVLSIARRVTVVEDVVQDLWREGVDRG